MSHERPRLDSLFAAAVEIESAVERAAFLDQSCDDDLDLRKQVEMLLQSDEQAGSFLNQPPITADRSMRSDSAEMPDRNSDSRYQIQGEIARGGMGEILKGRDIDLGRDVVIKVLLESHRDKPEMIRRFIEEAQIAGQLQHPGISPVYELGQFPDKRPFFAMKLVKGETLSQLLAQRAEPAEDRGRFIGIFEQICQTMAYAHSRGVIHRDLKPANIMVGAFGEVQVMDWGLAKVLLVGGAGDEKKTGDEEEAKSIIQTRRTMASMDVPGTIGEHGSETQVVSVMGTPAYMPPEQALGEIDQMDQRADVFGLGALLCEILTGQPPYVGKDSTVVFRMASRGKLDDAFARLENCDADPKLVALAKHCLASERNDRPADAGVLCERVTCYLESVESKLRDTELQRASEAARLVEVRKRLRVTLALALAVLVLFLGGGTLAWWRNQQSQLVRQRDARNAEAVAALLDQCENALRAGDAAKAEVTLEAAKKRSVEGGAGEYSKRLAQYTADLSLLRGLDAVDRYCWTLVDGRMPIASVTAKRTHETLARFGADPNTASVNEVAVRVTNSVVREQLVCALDRLLREEKTTGVRTLLRRLDADPYRNAVRDAIIADDAPKITELAGRKDALEQRPGFAAFLGESETIPLARRRQVLQAALIQQPGDLGLLMTLGRTYFPSIYYLGTEQGLDGALRWYQAAVATAPDSAIAYTQLGCALAANGKFDEGIAIYQKAIELEPDNARAHTNLGTLLKKQRRLDEAIISLRNAIQHDPKFTVAHTNLGATLLEKGQLDEAIASLRTAIQHDPTFANSHFHLGNALKRKGLLDESIACFQQAFRLDPEDAQSLSNLGNALLDKGQVEEAIACFERAIQVNPKLAKTHGSLGFVLFDQERYAEAKDAFSRVKTLLPEEDPVQAHFTQRIEQCERKLKEAAPAEDPRTEPPRRKID